MRLVPFFCNSFIVLFLACALGRCASGCGERPLAVHLGFRARRASQLLATGPAAAVFAWVLVARQQEWMHVPQAPATDPIWAEIGRAVRTLSGASKRLQPRLERASAIATSPPDDVCRLRSREE